MSRCGFCKSSSFELADATPNHSNFVYSFVQCASCHAVAGVVESVNPIAELETVKRQLKEIQARLGM